MKNSAEAARHESFRILAEGHRVSNDTWKTHLNNNDLVIGISGGGKTRGYVIPNIEAAEESLVITDTKGNLYQKMRGSLSARGYNVMLLDMRNLSNSCGYNPLDFIRFDKSTGRYNEQDMQTIAQCLVPENQGLKSDPFWDNAARLYLTCLIAYVMECLPPEEHTLEYVFRLYSEMQEFVPYNNPEYISNFTHLMRQQELDDPGSYSVRLWKLFRGNGQAEKMDASIRGILAEKLNVLLLSDLIRVYTKTPKVDFQRLGSEKTALFVYVSDCDRSMDRLANLFYTQALQNLILFADQCEGSRLPVPVRFILDDFATNTVIPDFDRIISIIRSREISVSLILQNVTQLNNLYGENAASTIINNCDHILYLGGSDPKTAELIGTLIDRRSHSILSMGIDRAWLIERGSAPKEVTRCGLF